MPYRITATACRWIGRTLAILLALFWGAFFLEHLSWFANPANGLPPTRVWIAQALHGVMIAGLLVMSWKDKPGTAFTIVATASFFTWIGMKSFPFLALLNLLPIAFFAVSWSLPRAPSRLAA
jgi:hypothetical protein